MSDEEQTPEHQPLQSIRWLHVCEAGIVDYATAALLIGSMANTPNLPEGDVELFKRAADRMARVVMQEVGRRAFEDAQDVAEQRYYDIATEARRLASGDARWQAAERAGETA